MNYRIVGRTAGVALLIAAASMALSMLVALFYGEDPLPFVWAILITGVCGFLLTRLRPDVNLFYAKEAYISVVGIWLAVPLFSALPFLFNGQFGSVVNCIFESVSGFTTTGASILEDIEALPKGILFWRSFTHYLGGMGVLVLTSLITSTSQKRFQHLMRAEMPGPTADKFAPRLRTSSRILYTIYLTLSGLCAICLMLTGLSPYHAAVVTFSTAGTGGFGVLNGSIAAYENPAAEMVVAVFMLLFAVNFGIYFLIASRQWRQAVSSEELLVYLGIIVAATALIFANVRGAYETLGDGLRHVFFTVTSIISSTGFATADFNLWPAFAQSLILILMLVGACAGSTGGGIKVARVIMIIKGLGQELRRMIHPKAVSVVRLSGKMIDDDTIKSVYRFIAAYFLITFGANLILTLDNYDFSTTFSAVISCMSNIGPGIGLVGPMESYALFSGLSKVVLSFCMILGRLEIFPILLFFAPSVWRKS